MTKKDLLLAWLNDAHSMEISLVPVLENHAKDLSSTLPMLEERIRQHAEETKDHARKVEGCIRRLGGKLSVSKQVLGAAIGAVQSVSTAPFKDELVKNALADFTAEHLEIASYNALIAAAEEVGDLETARVCSEIILDERAMAAWLQDHMPHIVRFSMTQQATT